MDLYPELAETDASADDRAARKAAKKAKKAAKKERKKEKKKAKKRKRGSDSSDSDSSSSAAPQQLPARPLRPGEVLLGGGTAAARKERVPKDSFSMRTYLRPVPPIPDALDPVGGIVFDAVGYEKFLRHKALMSRAKLSQVGMTV